MKSTPHKVAIVGKVLHGTSQPESYMLLAGTLVEQLNNRTNEFSAAVVTDTEDALDFFTSGTSHCTLIFLSETEMEAAKHAAKQLKQRHIRVIVLTGSRDTSLPIIFPKNAVDTVTLAKICLV